MFTDMLGMWENGIGDERYVEFSCIRREKRVKGGLADCPLPSFALPHMSDYKPGTGVGLIFPC